ncbi:hypothetical protein [Plebeiibacterium sediminum]|uniref:Helix-turn-helix domain-containing protein n=1 Tax=Plebeiibacterium sediminum TaxID=2992112 RepID=A0AAE3MAK0_9BACT|nr:hypothetical protein [Plebeiobacterium sediminum]MCW3789475.1 hypothetical protein [Plebeiobacterium sediminum]
MENIQLATFDDVNFNNLPKAIESVIHNQKLLMECFINNLTPPKPRPTKTNLTGLQDYLKEQTGKKPARQTLYGMVSSRKIPFIKHKNSKELVFNLNHIDLWLENGKSMRGLKLED